MYAVPAQCPACFEWIDIFVDQADRGTMVQDCDVCCRPMEATVQWSEEGEPFVHVVPAN